MTAIDRGAACAAAAREYEMGTQAAVLRELPAAVRVGPSLAASLRIQTVVAAVEEAAKDVRLVVTLTARTQNTAITRSGEPTAQWYLYYFQESISEFL